MRQSTQMLDRRRIPGGEQGHKLQPQQVSLLHHRLTRMPCLHPGPCPVGSIQRRVAMRARLITRDSKLVSGIADFAHFRMLMKSMKSTMCVLWILGQIAASLHGAGRHAQIRQLIHHLIGRLGTCPLLHATLAARSIVTIAPQSSLFGSSES